MDQRREVLTWLCWRVFIAEIASYIAENSTSFFWQLVHTFHISTNYCRQLVVKKLLLSLYLIENTIKN